MKNSVGSYPRSTVTIVVQYEYKIDFDFDFDFLMTTDFEFRSLILILSLTLSSNIIFYLRHAKFIHGTLDAKLSEKKGCSAREKRPWNYSS